MNTEELLDWYQIQAKRTCPDLGSEAINLSHMMLGICSEFSELLVAKSNGDFINCQEEISDKIWYLANYCNFRRYSLSSLWKEAEEELEEVNISEYTNDNYFYCLAELQDIVKKYLAYDKSIIDTDEFHKLVSYIVSMRILWKDVEFNLERGLTNNINKLKSRFPDKFDKDLAINRNLEAERIELEK